MRSSSHLGTSAYDLGGLGQSRRGHQQESHQGPDEGWSSYYGHDFLQIGRRSWGGRKLYRWVNHAAKMVRFDLDAARRAWVDEAGHNKTERKRREHSNYLAYRDDADHVADFHALRHTYISNLASAGVHPKIAQALARHSTITLTMDR
jgi:hypothetical protein